MTESASRSSDNARFSAPVREGQILAGKYLVQRQVSVGGMGVVFEARDTRLDRRVAIKVLLPRLLTSPTAAARFKLEAQAATRITSEHVVKVLEIDDLPDGTPFLVMEYLEGLDLRDLLRERGPLHHAQAVDYVLQALQAIAEAHRAQIVHRDLKPSNLFLAERADGTPLIKVLDFGIAKTLHALPPGDLALTSSEDVQLGSPTYMPPEQFQNPRDVDARADIWALGVTLYELISGRVPFQGTSYAQLVSQVLSRSPDSLATLALDAALPSGLEQIINKCLEKNRDRRFRDAVDLAVALAPFGSDDARLSLTRVSGLLRSRSAAPASVTRDTLGAYEATLPVAMDQHEALEPHSPTQSGARPVSGPVRRRVGSALAIALGVAVLTAGALGLRTLRSGDLTRRGIPDRPPATSLSRALPAPVASHSSTGLENAVPPPSAVPSANLGTNPAGGAPSNRLAKKAASRPPGAPRDTQAPTLPPTDNAATDAGEPVSTVGQLGQSPAFESLFAKRKN